MKNSFSLWIPLDELVKKELEVIINQLSKDLKGFIFEPHLTLLGNIHKEKKSIQNISYQLASKLKPFTISLGEVSFSTTYFQSVFIRAKASAPLMEANLLAKKLFGLKNDVFMPHISLLYGNHEMKQRENATKQIKLLTKYFIASRIIVTPSTPNPKNWIHLVEYPFCR